MLCTTVPQAAENALSPVQPKIIHARVTGYYANKTVTALRQLHMLSETAAVRTQVACECENAGWQCRVHTCSASWS